MFSVMNQRYDEAEEMLIPRKARNSRPPTGEPKKPRNMAIAVQDLQDQLATKGEKLRENIERLGHHAVCLQFMFSCF